MNNKEKKESYDELVYKANPFADTAMMKLEAYAYFYGLNPQKATKARVLELGTSFGGNLIAQAINFEDNYYVGVDLSHEQIKKGNEIIKKLGLKNIELHQKDILTIDESFGKFDYIISHGVFSWVPNDVKHKMIEICNQNLNENGIAYLSYNTYPGWKEASKVRDMMMYVNKFYPNLSLLEKTERGRLVVEIFKEQIELYPDLKERSKGYLEWMDSVLKHKNYYLGHEYLEMFNDPLYIHQFAELADKNGLKYFTDTNLKLSMATSYKKETVEKLQQLSGGDNVIKEQCIDFILDTKFRKSLMCKKSQTEKLNFSESIPNTIIDTLYYVIKNKIEIAELEDKVLEEALKHLLSKKHGEFQIEDAKKFLEDKDLNQEQKDKIVQEIRGFILNNVITGNLNFYLTRIERVSFVENKTYVPEKFIKYVEVILSEDGQYIGIGNFKNEIFPVDTIELLLLQQLKEPTTKDKLISELEKLGLKRMVDGKEEDVDPAEYLEMFLEKYENLNFFKRK